MSQESESARPGPRTTEAIIHLFERWVRETPDARAVVSGGTHLSYRELDLRANRLAHHLRDAGLPAGGIVAVGTDRMPDVLVAVLAVLKAGGAYAVVDPRSAPATVRRQLDQADPFAVVTDHDNRARLDHGDGRRTICLDSDAREIAAHPAEPLDVPPGGTAAVLFTAAGSPRAVPVGHARLVAAYEGWAEVYGLTPQDRHLVTARPDATVFTGGWIRALCSGGALVLPERRSGEAHRLIDAESVTVVDTDPAGAARLLRSTSGQHPALSSVRLLTVTGDRLYLDEQADLHRRLPPDVRLLNVYGVTEAAGCGTWFELSQLSAPAEHPGRVSLIGTPFPGCRVDTDGDGGIRLTPPGGGDAIPTGDFGRLREDGLLEYRGRARHRVAAGRRSFDPYRVESLLHDHPQIGACLVVAAEGGARSGRLVAYAVPSGTAAVPDAAEVRTYLTGLVPAEEIPGAVVRLRSLPRTRAGQEDRGALPQPAQPAGQGPAAGGKADRAPLINEGVLVAVPIGCGVIIVGFFALMWTDLIWPGSTDLSAVPDQWSGFFRVLYVVECVAFAAGVMFLFTGYPRMRQAGKSRGLTMAAHLAIVYLLISWWPQDNFYRLAAKDDWSRQAALVYVFNVPLMIAAAIIAVYATRKPADPEDDD
ncbi:AMP-binding protein [Streptomyces sp. A3M-1-3]|uniref:AMP-binding protein n=1 Tax=Streptomyces sp. A3M-1-3 TaxID=2962044 RepID=UPI0020B643B6|nr:AMP-binding protein [Streptomyces sp. A3M-1-3]MCP3818251.1 AMP-binding protein [Streptomyces sp. A3M-1-3]